MWTACFALCQGHCLPTEKKGALVCAAEKQLKRMWKSTKNAGSWDLLGAPDGLHALSSPYPVTQQHVAPVLPQGCPWHAHNAVHTGFQWIPPQSSGSCKPEVADDGSRLKTKEGVLPLPHTLGACASWQPARQPRENPFVQGLLKCLGDP